MKVLITGGLGNLGTWITEHLFDSGFEVTTFSLRDRDVLREYEFERIFGDIENEDDLERLFSNRSWDAVIHLASINENNLPDYFNRALKINTLGTRKLLQTIADSGNQKTHFIYFSTFHIYGLSSGFIEEDKIIPYPKNDYANTHLFAEKYVKQFYFSHKLPFTILRLTNSYGAPKEKTSSKWHLVVNDLAKMALEKNVIKLASNGLPQRDFIWLGDVCDVVEKCLLKGATNDIFNLGSGTSISMLEIAETVKKAYENKFSSAIEIQKNDLDMNRYDETLEVSIEKLQNRIDFNPQNKIYEEVIAIFDLLNDS